MVTLQDSDISDILSVHNNERDLFCIPHLTWDPALAQAAYTYLSAGGGACPSGHSTQAARDANFKAAGGTCTSPVFAYCSSCCMVGENIAASTGDTIKTMTTYWINAAPFYEKNDFMKSCGSLPSDDGSDGHYTQLVWSGTTRVGCAVRKDCGGMQELLCNYYPLGNFNTQTTYAFDPSMCGGCKQNTSTPVSTTNTPKTTTTNTPKTTTTNTPKTTTTNTPASTTNTPASTTNTPASTTNTPVTTSSGTYSIPAIWTNFMGSYSDWTVTSTNTATHNPSTLSILTLPGTTANTVSGTNFWIVGQIVPGTSTKFGLAINAKGTGSSASWVDFRYDGGKYYLYAESPNSWSYYYWTGVPVNNLLKVNYYISGSTHYYQPYVGSTALNTITIPASFGGGTQGIYAAGVVGFQNFYVRTPTTVTFTLNSCTMSSTDISNLIASQTGTLPANMVITKLGCSKKRDTQAVESVSVVLIGDSESLSYTVAQNLVSNPGSMISNIVIEDVSPIVVDSGAVAIGSQAIVATGLSAGAIAGIAVGSAAAAVAIGLGIYFGVKSKDNTRVEKKPEEEPVRRVEIQEETHQQDVEDQQPKQQDTRKPKKGVDVFNLDPNNPTSITMRNPNAVVKTEVNVEIKGDEGSKSYD